MYGLYKKNETNFAVVWIIIYVVLGIIADNVSALLGITKIINAPMGIVLSLNIYYFIKKYNLLEKYGLCFFKGNLKNYLYFIPLVLMITIKLFWSGVTVSVPVIEVILFIVSMLCVGFIEEVIFRGFLFKAMCKDNVKMAIVVSSITFGIGHIVSLLTGQNLIATLLQICGAIAIGFLFTIIFYKGKSLWPCIIAHGVYNAVSIFRIKAPSQMSSIIFIIVVGIICMAYTLWILRVAKKHDVQCSKAESKSTIQ